MDPFVGMRFGRYELLARLGSGGMGEVWRARDHDLERDVAVKFLPERFASDKQRLGRFAQEARAASSLNHPTIVTIHEIGQSEGLPFIVMELVLGRTLHDLHGGQPLPPRRVLEIGAQIAEGLAKAHGAGIVHRDLKPDNVMVTSDGLVKILDFGLAKLLWEGSGDKEQWFDSRAPTWPELETAATGSGVVLGTVGYMSPEQARGRPVDFRSDQFALGAILYELATGRQAFRRESPAQTLAAIIEDEPTPIGAIVAGFPAEARSLIEKRCLAKDPAERYAATIDLARELRARLLEPISSASVVTPARRRFAVAWLIPLAAVLTIAIAGPTLRSCTPQRVRLALGLESLPTEKRIAVLPFRVSAPGSEDQALGNGLMDIVTVRLAQLEGGQLWVEPSAQVVQSGIRDAARAARVLNANLVISGSVQRISGRLVITAALEDAERGRTLRAAKAEDVDALVEEIVGMLQLELTDAKRSALKASASGVVEAATLAARGIGYSAYAEGRSALERFDQAKQIERAIELFNASLERDPNYTLARAALAEAYWRLYDATRKPEYVPLAREHCRRALAQDDLLSWPWTTLGTIESGTGHGEQAIAAFQKAIERDPRSADAYRELGAAQEKLGRLAEAEATLRKAIELRPRSWSSYAYLGRFFVRQQRLDESAGAFARALELAPDNAMLWSNLGAVRYFQKRAAEARQAYEKSLGLHWTARAASNLAMLQFSKGEYGLAAATLERATGSGTRDYQVWRNLAGAYNWVPGQRDKAAAAYRRAAELALEELSLDPHDATVLIDLADCYSMTGQRQLARRAAAEALAQAPSDPTVAWAAAQLYEDLADREAALRWLGVALRAGFPLGEVESSPTLSSLRRDPRYAALAAASRTSRPERR